MLQLTLLCGLAFNGFALCYAADLHSSWFNCFITNRLLAVYILLPKCRQQRLDWSYFATSPKLGRNEV